MRPGDGPMRKRQRHPGIIEIMKPFIAVRVVDEHEGDPASMDEGQDLQVD